MKARTPEEIKAYVDGYNACFNQFCEILKARKNKPIAEKIKTMQIFVNVVNNVSEGGE